jgi:hypothetical protein
VFLAAGVVSGATPSNPFCAAYTQRNVVELALGCVNGVIDQIEFASYGTPSGSCPNYVVNASCNSPQSMSFVQAACLGKSFCLMEAGANGNPPDPCPGIVKSVVVVAHCSEGPGGAQLPLLPSCATTNGAPPCPLPVWEPTYQLNRSTIAQPGNTEGYLNATEAGRWGLLSLDWSIANGIWNTGNRSNATGAATLVEQCRQIKAVNPLTKCFVYRNTELALEWLEPQRAVMYDPQYADYFLQYQPGNPSNTTPGTIYNEDAGAPAAGYNQFFWNYSNPDAVSYVLNVSEQGLLGTASPWVDGTFLDDSQAIPQEHGNAPTNIGLSAYQLAILQNGTHAFVQLAISTLAANGHYIWQGFNNNPGGDPDAVAPGPSAATCSSYMATVCEPSWQSVPMTMQWQDTDKDQILAGFLIGRGPYAYLGYGWNGGPLPSWDPMWDLDVGEPTAPCEQTDAGVFFRPYTNGNATLDCNTWTATLNFHY